MATIISTGTDVFATNNDDTIVSTAVIGTKQIHIYSKGGNDNIELDFASDISNFQGWVDDPAAAYFSHGHHVRGDRNGSLTRGEDIFNFTNISNVSGDAVVVGRIEDFDASRDVIQIEGQSIDIHNLPSNVRLVHFDGNHNDAGAGPQYWIIIETPTGGTIFYSLEGARVDLDGNGHGNSGEHEGHFLKYTDLPDFDSLQDVPYIDPVNYAPAGFTPEAGGKIIDDYDFNESVDGDVSTPVRGTHYGDVIAAGLNDDLVFAGRGDDIVWGGTGHDVIHGEDGNDILYGGFGNDHLHAGEGDAAQGVQELYGQAGNDHYHISANSGDVILTHEAEAQQGPMIMSTGGHDHHGHMSDGHMNHDMVVFTDVNMADIEITSFDFTFGGTVDDPNGVALVLNWDGGSLTIANEAEDIEMFVFADGSSVEGFSADAWSNGRDRVYGTDGDNIIATGNQGWANTYGGDGNDTIIGGDGRDYIFGGNGDDRISVGQNSYDGVTQAVFGQAGSDTYVISRDHGSMLINNRAEDASATDVDRVEFVDLNPADIEVFTHDFGNADGIGLIMSWDGGRVTIANMGQDIEEFVFADGTVLTQIDPDNWDYGATLIEVAQNTTLVLNHDDPLLNGAPEIVIDAALNDVEISSAAGTGANGDFLVLSWAGGSVTVANDGDAIDSFVFADGSTVSSFGADDWSNGRDRLYGSDDDDVIRSADDGWANVYGQDGDDVLIGGEGRDYLFGGDGDDTLSAGGNARDNASQLLFGQAGSDTYHIMSTDESVQINHAAERASSTDHDEIVFLDLASTDVDISMYDYTNGGTNSNRNGEALVISWETGELMVANRGQEIEQITFSDGVVLTTDEFLT